MSDDNIIHVSFQNGTRKRRRTPCKALRDATADRPGSDPLSDLYTVEDVARLFNYSTGRLRYWARSGLVKPSVHEGNRRYYTFQDLISLRAAKSLIEAGVTLRSVRASVEALRASLPKVARPLCELRVVADGRSVVVRDKQGVLFEPTTGQALLEFPVESLREDVVRVLHSGPGGQSSRRKAAYDYYLEGCRLDEDAETRDAAERAYEKAIELDPTLANALTNLGNMRYQKGNPQEAAMLYRQAVELDPEQPEARYNLGFIAYEHGDLTGAAHQFEQAIATDPGFADAHFNLAMVHQERGDLDQAARHWKVYLQLDPTGPWADIARRHLDPV